MNISRRVQAVILILLTLIYLLGTLPDLENFPLMEWAQPMIAAPAWNLASTGVYGSEMFTGFYGAERHNYDHMPLYSLFVALAFKVGGVGIFQARIVSVLAGLAAVYLVYWIGKSWFDPLTGLLAATLLSTLRLGVPNFEEVLRLGYQMNATGIPLLDFARVIRFDGMVPMWVLSSCLVFVWAYHHESRWGVLGAGVLSGLATLTHLYGAFILPVLILALIWQKGPPVMRRTALIWLGLGFCLAILPYLFYIFQDLPGFRGQALRHENRFELWNLRFYWESLIHEPWRYISWIGGSFRHPVVWPRLGIFVLIGGILLANLRLWHRIRQKPTLEEKLLFLSLPVLAGSLALLINLKRYPYTALLLPFLALQLSIAGVWLWNRAGANLWRRAILGGLLGLIFLEAASGIVGAWHMGTATTPYAEIEAGLTEVIPNGARVLSTHIAWFALPETDFRSVNLLFILTDPQYGYSNPPTVPEVIAQLAPEYIIMEERLLKIYMTDPTSLPNMTLARKWRAIDEYIQMNCPPVARIPAPDYGDIVAYQCVP